jgi:hypothetical protein
MQLDRPIHDAAKLHHHETIVAQMPSYRVSFLDIFSDHTQLYFQHIVSPFSG